MSRLADIESRLKSIEERGTLPPNDLAMDSTGARPAVVAVPHFHTASAENMLHCWPRIRLNLAVPNVGSTAYLAEFDQIDDDGWSEAGPASQLLTSQVIDAINHFYNDLLPGFPLLVADLFSIPPALEHLSVLGNLPPESRPLKLHELSVAQLLVLSLASAAAAGSMEAHEPPVRDLSAQAMTIALQKQWQLVSRPDEERIPLLLLTAYALVYFSARPFHALSLLQAVDVAIKASSLKRTVQQVPLLSRDSLDGIGLT